MIVPPRHRSLHSFPILAAIAAAMPPGSVVLLFPSGNLETET